MSALGLPAWARHAPDHLVVPSNESGSWQLWAWDCITGDRRRVTDEPIGVTLGLPTPDGNGVVWFSDSTGEEVGQWLFEPFDGTREHRRPLAAGVPNGWGCGLALEEGVVVIGRADGEGFEVYVAEGNAPAVVLQKDQALLKVAGLSRDASLLCLEEAREGNNIHLGLRVLDRRTGHTVGRQWDGTGFGLKAARWAPVEGDQRLAIVQERTGRLRPGLWDLVTGCRRDVEVDLPGDVSVMDWWPDASALLVIHRHHGRHQLFHLQLDSEELSAVEHPLGTVSAAAVRPDGEVWFHFSSGTSPPSIRSSAGYEVLTPVGPRAPEGGPFQSWWFRNPEGQKVHGFVAVPPGPAPHPVVMHVHGGPDAAYADAFLPEVQAWVDHGYAVALVNYRGSTGYGTAFRDALIGNPGFPEVADIVVGLDSLVAEGLVDPRRVVLKGGSWGGYVTLLALGLHPQRWACAVAAMPVADYLTAYEDEAPELKAFDRSLFGGSPDEVGDLYRERSPLTYVHRVSAPVLIIAGDHDSLCPIRQVLNYVGALVARGADVEFHRFEAGHGSLVVDERVRHMAAQLAFVLARVPPGPSSSEG